MAVSVDRGVDYLQSYIDTATCCSELTSERDRVATERLAVRNTLVPVFEDLKGVLAARHGLVGIYKADKQTAANLAVRLFPPKNVQIICTDHLLQKPK